MKILITDGMSPEGIDLLKQSGHEVVEQFIPQEELPEKIKGYDAIIVRSATKVPREVIEASNLKAIGRAGVGTDNIDKVAAKEHNIPVLNTPAASSISVAELALGHIFALSRFIHVGKEKMKGNGWPKKEFSKGTELTGKTIGIMGIGNIGTELAKRAKGLGMNVIATDIEKTSHEYAEIVEEEKLYKDSDIISVHVPAKKDGSAYISGAELGNMKDGVMIVNCARGGCIDEAELLNALNSGKVRGAGIDVFETEPISESQKDLVEHPNTSVSPHIGGSTVEAQDRVGIEIAERIIESLKN
ncbi:MAG: D-2-hydroxyacid dehydrogenase [Candidatus Kapaibacteriales bacterium]